LTARTRKTCKKMKVKLKVIEDEMIVKTEESEFKTRTAVGIGRFLTQKVIRSDKYKQLITHEVHRASYTTLKRNEISNTILTNIYSRKSNTFFRFVVVGRAYYLLTLVNLRRWFADRGSDKRKDGPIADLTIHQQNKLTNHDQTIAGEEIKSLVAFFIVKVGNCLRENRNINHRIHMKCHCCKRTRYRK
jgi:hypothetical protein